MRILLFNTQCSNGNEIGSSIRVGPHVRARARTFEASVPIPRARKLEVMSNVVKSAISSIITEPDCSERGKTAKEQARIFLRATESMQPFEDFCLTLTKMIEKNFSLVCLLVEHVDPKVSSEKSYRVLFIN